MRILTATLLAGALALAGLPLLRAGDDPLAGNWRVIIHEDGQQVSFWLVSFASKDGKPAATVEPLKNIPPTTLDNFKVTGDVVQFTLRIKGGPTFDYEGKLPRAGAKKVFGSLSRDGGMIPVVLEATGAKNAFELNRELLTRTPSDPRSFSAMIDVIGKAKENKVPVKDVQEWVEGSLKAAELFGPRWQFAHALKLVEALQRQPELAPVAVDAARKAEGLLSEKAPAETRLRLLSVMADALRGAKKLDEARAVEARVDKLETQAYTEYSKAALDFKVEKYAGRKAKSDRKVLVELFTGAQCPPCVAADVAFDALAQAYSPEEVVLVQYHMHIPQPDPMSTPDGDTRFDSYSETFPRAVRGTPAILFNGKPEAPGGGGKEDAADKFKEYREVVDKLLEKPAAARVTARAVRKGDKVQVSAKVQEVEKAGEKVKLRFALVEDWVRYKGRNGLAYHHRVVRALPGGAKGFDLTGKAAEHTASVDLGALRETLSKYLDEAYPEGQRPMRMRDLHLVAFVQNDETGEILQAVDVPVREE